MRPCTIRDAEMGKSTRELSWYDNRVNAVVGSQMKGYRNEWQDNSWTLPIRIDSHLQIAYEFHWATRQDRDNAISANSLGHLTYLKKAGERQCATSFKIYPEWYRAWTNELQRHQTLYVGFSLSWPVNRLCGILFNRFYRLEIHSLMVDIFDPSEGERMSWKVRRWAQSSLGGRHGSTALGQGGSRVGT